MKLIDRSICIEEMNEGIRKIRNAGLRVVGSFILGIPSETREEMEQTIEYAKSLPLDGVSFFTFTPYPNTNLRNLAYKYGNVSTNWLDYSGHPNSLPYIPDGMTQDELLNYQEKAYKEFLVRPSYIYRYLTSHSLLDTLKKGWLFLHTFYLGKTNNINRS